MSIFAKFQRVSLKAAKTAPKKKTPAEKMAQNIQDQIDILSGKQVINSNNSPKKSWLTTVKMNGKEVQVVKPTIGNRAIFSGEGFAVANREEALELIEAMRNWEQDEEMKNSVLAIYEDLSKPKQKKK